MSAGSSNDENTATLNTANRPIDELDAKVPPCLVLVVGPAKFVGKQWPMDKPSITLGRISTSDICIEEIGLSKSHAKFSVYNEKVSITDLHATNKTIVNGQVLKPFEPFLLQNNDQIKAGALVFKFLQKGILSETSEKARMQTELEAARTVQTSLLPSRQEARYQSVQIGGRYRPATECSGDWWWHWSCGDKAFAIIGDVTGHGAGAALITSAARGAITTIEGDASVGIDKVYTILSRALYGCAGGSIIMSAFIVEVTFWAAKLRYINASHTPAVWLPDSISAMRWNGLQHLTGGISPALGMQQDDYSIAESAVHPGARLMLLTDGITERADSSGAIISQNVFYKMLIEAHAAHVGSQSDFLDLLLRRSNEMAGQALQDDDITVVALDFF